MTHSERILALLVRFPDLDDDEIASRTGIRPRQAVNQACRRLEHAGRLSRFRGPRGKIVNRLVHGSGTRPDVDRARVAGAATATIARPTRRMTEPPKHAAASRCVDRGWQVDPQATLIVIPCSGRKRVLEETNANGPSLLSELPEDLASRLAAARTGVRERARIDETTRVAAWRRYDGALYQACREGLQAALAEGVRVAIISGGYGLLLADEPIGVYEARFQPGWWPRGVLGEVLAACARRWALRHVRGFLSASTAYRRVFESAPWSAAGVDDALLLAPQLGAGEGAMVTGPRAQGEAIACFLRGQLAPGWSSSDGVALAATASRPR